MTNSSGRVRFVAHGWIAHDNELTLHGSVEGRSFLEVFRFPFPVRTEGAASAVLDLLAIVAMVSYAKAFAPCTVEAPEFALTGAGRALVESAFGDGMAEFAHTTGIEDPIVLGDSAHRSDVRSEVSAGRPLIPVGGGRDSAVVATALLGLDPYLLSIGGSDAARHVAATLRRDLLVVERTVDPLIIELNAAGAPNGHVPVTAITMLASTVAAIALGSPVVVMANEASASNPTRTVGGRGVNHQHSKSLAFELLLDAALRSVGSPAVCVSALRNASDTRIARVFAGHCTALHPEFVSCNRAGVRDPAQRSQRWCGNCAKCRSIALSLAPHMSPAQVTAIIGADLLDDETQLQGFADLLDADRKPFECVQTVEEARAAVGALADSPRWREHAVVRGLARLAGPAPKETHEPLGPHVPAEIRDAMEAFFS